MSETSMREVASSPPSGDLVKAVSVSRLVSDMAAIDEFYTSAVGATQTQKYAEGNVTRHCYQWPGGKGDVCFVNRPDSATAGELKARPLHQELVRGQEGLLPVRRPERRPPLP